MSRQQTGNLMILLSSVFFATEGIFAKLCYSSGMTVNCVLAWRFTFAALIMTVLLLVRGESLRLPRRLWKNAALSFVVYILLSRSLNLAFRELPPAAAILVYYTFPLILVLLSALVQKKLPSAKIAFCVVLGFAGILIFSFGALGTLSGIGLTYALVAAFANAVNMYLLHENAERGMPTLPYIGNLFIGAAVVYWTLGLLGGEMNPAAVPPIGWLGVGGLALFICLGGQILLLQGVTRADLLVAGVLTNLEPPVTALLSFLVFREVWCLPQYVGALVVLSTVVLISIIENRKKQEEQKRHSAA